MAVLVIRIETTAYYTTQTVYSLNVQITTRRKFNRFVVISRIGLAKSDPTLGPSPHTLLTTTMMLTTIRIPITTLTESLTTPLKGQNTTRAPR